MNQCGQQHSENKVMHTPHGSLLKTETFLGIILSCMNHLGSLSFHLCLETLMLCNNVPKRFMSSPGFLHDFTPQSFLEPFQRDSVWPISGNAKAAGRSCGDKVAPKAPLMSLSLDREPSLAPFTSSTLTGKMPSEEVGSKTR